MVSKLDQMVVSLKPSTVQEPIFNTKDYFDQITVTNSNYLGRFRKYLDDIQKGRRNPNFRTTDFPPTTFVYSCYF